MHALIDAIAAMDPPPGEPCRIFHGRGGLHPGCEPWVLDVYPPVFVLTAFEPADEDALAAIGRALAARWAQVGEGPLNWVFQCRHDGPSTTRLMAGSVPDPHVVSEDGARYKVQLLRGQNHGLFLDMAEGRRWVRRHAVAHPGLRVLNLFAYTGAFSVAAMQGGAARVLNIDMSSGALATAQQNHHLNGITSGAAFMAHDIFSSWGKIGRAGPYDLVIADPPSYQKGSFVATKDYVRLLRRLPDLLAPGGHALLCLNAPELGADFLHAGVREAAPALQPVMRVPNPTAFADVSEDRALKVLVYRKPADAPEAMPG